MQGFAADISVNQGETARFKVDAGSTPYRIDIYRLGWYGGQGARFRGTATQPSPTSSQPACTTEAATGLIECGNWGVSATWAVPASATSGLYIGVVKTLDGAPQSHIAFVVRDDDGRSDLLFQTSDTTWQAYNSYGGNSLYTGSPAGRAYKVSYDRPFNTAGGTGEDWLFNSEYPMIRWLERNGFDVSYFTGVDGDRLGGEIREHKAFLSVGHDEYWSGGQRANVEAARNAGVDLAFFSGNEVFWKTRWEDNHRTLVSYKETHAGAKIDPLPNVWTGTWRDPRFSPPADGGRPENALTGTSFLVNSGTRAIEVPAAEGRMRLWRGTAAASLPAGGVETLPDGTLGYEWDTDPDNGARPAGLVRLSSTTATDVEILQDFGSTYATGNANHYLTLYRDPNGAGAGWAGVRRRHRPVVVGPRRGPRPRRRAREPGDAAGDVQPVRRHGRPAGHAAGRPAARVGVDRHDRADRHDHLAGDDRRQRRHAADDPGDGDGPRRRRGRRRRGVGRRRRDLAPRRRTRHLDLHVDPRCERHRHAARPRRGRQRQPDRGRSVVAAGRRQSLALRHRNARRPDARGRDRTRGPRGRRRSPGAPGCPAAAGSGCGSPACPRRGTAACGCACGWTAAPSRSGRSP